MKLREPCELRRDEIKSGWTRKKSNGFEKNQMDSKKNLRLAKKFFICQPIFQIFLWLFDLRARALRSLRHWILLILALLKGSYYLTIIRIFN